MQFLFEVFFHIFYLISEIFVLKMNMNLYLKWTWTICEKWKRWRSETSHGKMTLKVIFLHPWFVIRCVIALTWLLKQVAKNSYT